MGLFDFYGANPNDQAQMALIGGLLAGQGNFNQVLGKALLGGQGAYNNASEIDVQNNLRRLGAQRVQQELKQNESQMADQDAIRRFWANPKNYMQPGMQAPGDYGPGEAPQLPAGPASPQFVAQQMLASGAPALASQGYQGMQKSLAPTTVKPGETLGVFDPTTGRFNPSYTGPKDQPTSPLAELIAERNKLPPGHPMIKIYDAAIEKASTHQPPIVQMGLGSPVPVTLSDGRQVLVQPPTKPGGKAEVVNIEGQPVRPQAADKPMTAEQGNANLYANRMEKADKIIQDLEGKYNRGGLAFRQRSGDGVIGTAANAALSPNAQMVDQAQRDFVNAILRRESGAAISQSEFENARLQYFPQPGDSDQVVKQKSVNRRTAIEGLRAMVGNRAPQAGSNNDPLGLR